MASPAVARREAQPISNIIPIFKFNISFVPKYEMANHVAAFRINFFEFASSFQWIVDHYNIFYY